MKFSECFANAVVAAFGDKELLADVFKLYSTNIQAITSIGPLCFVLFKDDSAVIDDNGAMITLEHYSLTFEAVNEWLLTNPQHRSIFEVYGNV